MSRMMLLNESLFENYEEEWSEVDSKDVMDSDGFYTTYTWYTNGKKHIFMFGDPDLYGPDEDYSDWEVEIYPGNEENAMEEAQEWFDNYKGFDDSEDDESLNESTVIQDEDKVSAIVNYIYADVELPSDITEDEVEEFNANQLADYIFYREWEGDDSILPEAVEKLEAAYKENFGDNDDGEILEEDFSPSLPKWLINYLERNPKIKNSLSNYKHLDLANMKYVRIPRNEFPANGFHPLLKDANKQLVYLIRDNNRNIVYLPGINDNNISLHIDPDDDYKSVNISGVSKKILLDYAVALGYIDKNDGDNLNSDKQLVRSASRRNSIERGKGQYSQEITKYPEKEDGSKDYDNPIKSIFWSTSRGQDKSGYDLNPTKYKDMLDSADLHTYGLQFERYTKKLNKLKGAIIDAIQGMRVDKSVSGGWSSGIQYAVRYFEEAIQNYEDLQKNIERILSHDNLTEEEKDYHIKDEFDATRSYGTVGGLRKAIEKAWDELNEFKEKAKGLDSQGNIEESVDWDSIKAAAPNDEMAKLAQKHNLDILTPMDVEPGSMRISGTIRDLDNFYKEAEELGLLKLEEDNLNEKFKVKDLDHLKEIGDKLNLTSASDIDEFRKIADEIGLNDEDLDTFIKEEMSEGENGLEAIKRYKEELIESGIDLSKLKTESLNEGAMKDLAMDLDAGEDFISILKRDLVPLKKQLYALEDSNASEEEIQKVKDDISKVEAKLAYLNKRN